MKRIEKSLLLVILAVLDFSLGAQVNTCQHNKQAQVLAPIYPCQENLRSDTIDILKYTITADITDFVTDTIRCNTIVKFKPKMNGQNKIRLDLLKMKIDSIKLNSNKLTYTYNDTVMNVNLPLTYNTTDTVSIAVYYHGKPQGDPSGWGGFYFNGTYAFNLGVGFGARPHNYGRVWFPCFDNFVEKSQYEFNIITDISKRAYCNGQLMSDVATAGKRTRNWVMQKEIPSYLASVAVADYTQVNWTHTVTSGTIPIVLAARPTDTTNLKNGFVNLKNAITAYEFYYGPYVWNRVGYCLVPFSSGAMEHATNIAYPQAAISIAYESILMAHELSHHWWGDLMTCETQEDMWLNEGMATYSQYMFNEYVYNKAKYYTDIKNEHEYLLHYAHIMEKSYRAVSGVPHQYTYGDHVYKKGADVAHTLRTYMGDAAFFAGLKYVLTQKAYQTMNSAEFKTLLETSSGQTLSDFFNAWVFAGGWPHFSIDSVKFTSIGSGSYSAAVSLKQKLVGAPALYNSVPLEVSFFDNNWNRTVKSFTMSGANQNFTTTLNFNPVYSAINYDSKISDGITSEVKTFKTNTVYNYLLAKTIFTVTALGSDSSLIRVEHNYAKPDPIKYNIKKYKLSNQHYWKIDGILSPGCIAKAQFNYDGTPVPVIPVAGGTYTYMDTCLTSTGSDSLFLLYRRNAADDWREVYSFSKVKAPGGKIGRITIDTLKLGEYVFANRMGIATGVNSQSLKEKISLKLYPNPASGEVTIQLSNADLSGVETVEIKNLEGKVVRQFNLTHEEQTLNCSGLASGSYLVTVSKQKKVIAREKLIIQ
jgi:aminopeptidase N